MYITHLHPDRLQFGQVWHKHPRWTCLALALGPCRLSRTGWLRLAGLLVGMVPALALGPCRLSGHRRLRMLTLWSGVHTHLDYLLSNSGYVVGGQVEENGRIKVLPGV